MWLAGSEPGTVTITAWCLQVEIQTQTGVGATNVHAHYKAIDYAKKGDGGLPSAEDSTSDGDLSQVLEGS